jgi:hypothetical protein
MEEEMQIRQGDVLCVMTNMATGEEEETEGARGVVLAEGKVTGHAHRIASGHAALLQSGGVRYLRVGGTEPVALEHEEHKTRCATCHSEGRWRVATHRMGGHTQEAYRCAEHGAGATALKSPGATDIPPGDYRVIIHAEYEPGALPRQVED